MKFRETLPADPVARQLLNDYFTHRSESFTGEQGYSIVFPDDKQFTPPRGVFLVVETDEQSVACGGIRYIDSREPGEVWCEVKHLWVEPSVRGRGLGRKILTELETRAMGFGASHLVLDTNATLEAAGGLYVSAGYAPVEPYNDNPNATNWYKKPLTM